MKRCIPAFCCVQSDVDEKILLLLVRIKKKKKQGQRLASFFIPFRRSIIFSRIFFPTFSVITLWMCTAHFALLISLARIAVFHLLRCSLLFESLPLFQMTGACYQRTLKKVYVCTRVYKWTRKTPPRFN